jgi:hypothetical protein
MGSRAVMLAASKSRRLCLRKKTSARAARFVAMGHLLAVDRDAERVHCITGAAPRSESVAKSEEVFLVDHVQQRSHRPLDNLANVDPPARTRLGLLPHRAALIASLNAWW